MSFLNPILWPSVLLAIGAVFSICGALWAASEQARFEHELRIKSEEIAALNRTIVATVTGGDTFPYLLIGRPGTESQVADLMLLTEGKYPLYDVSVRIQDVDKFLESVMKSIDSGEAKSDSILGSIKIMQQASIERAFGNVSPNLGIPFGSIDLSGRSEASFNVTLFARNGSVSQQIRFKRSSDEWAMGYKVTRNGAVLREEVDAGFIPEW